MHRLEHQQLFGRNCPFGRSKQRAMKMTNSLLFHCWDEFISHHRQGQERQPFFASESLRKGQSKAREGYSLPLIFMTFAPYESLLKVSMCLTFITFNEENDKINHIEFVTSSRRTKREVSRNISAIASGFSGAHAQRQIDKMVEDGVKLNSSGMMLSMCLMWLSWEL